MAKTLPVGRSEERVNWRGHVLQRVPEGPSGEPAFYIAVRPASHHHYAALALGATPPAIPRASRRAPRSWGGHRVPASLHDAPIVDIGAEDARALADWWQLRLPTLDEWQRAARAGLLTDGSGAWEWTSTPAPPGGFFVCGGRFRDRPGDPPSLDNVSFEVRPAEDVGVRFVGDAAAPIDEASRPSIDAGELTLPPDAPWTPRAVKRPTVTSRTGPVLLLSDRSSEMEALIVDAPGGPCPARVRRHHAVFGPNGPIAYVVLAALVVGRGQNRRFAAWQEPVPPAWRERRARMFGSAAPAFDVLVAHQIEPGPSLMQVFHALDERQVRVPAAIAAAVGVRLARAWRGLGLGRRSLALPIGASLHPTPDEVSVGYSGRLLTSPEVREWSKTAGGPSANDLAWQAHEHVVSEPAIGYSIAAIVFALLTGRSPAYRTPRPPAEGADRISALITASERYRLARRPPVRVLRPDTPAALAAIVDACLQPTPAARLGSLTELEAALSGLADLDEATAFFARFLAEVWPEERAADLGFWEAAAALPITPPSSSEVVFATLPEDPLSALESAIPDQIDYY